MTESLILRDEEKLKKNNLDSLSKNRDHFLSKLGL